MLRLFILLLPLLMVACTPLGQQKPLVEKDPEEMYWNDRHPVLEKITNWQIQGRAVVSESRESWNVGLVWSQFDDAYQIKLQGPFSQGGAILEGRQGEAILLMDNGEILSATSPNIFLTEVLNIPMPLEALRDWVKGMPYSKQPYESISFDQYGRLRTLVQQGWQIDIKRYIPFEDGVMPAKVFIKKDDRRLRIIVSDWDRTAIDDSKNWANLK